MAFIDFLRKYGPIPRNDNMYDEHIQRSARWYGVQPIVFHHPFADRVLECITQRPCGNLILTGTAGDGKTHLCREAWKRLGGDPAAWASDGVTLTTDAGQAVHFIGDLTAWAPQQGSLWATSPEKMALTLRLVHSCLGAGSADAFVLAGNDGQLLEAFRRLEQETKSDEVTRFREVLAELLVEDKASRPGLNLVLLNLSRGSSAELFDRAIKAFIEHDGWRECLAECDVRADCPVRMNYDLLKSASIQGRLRKLFELCDHSGMHLPIRQILLLLANAVLGHPEAQDGLMRETDVRAIIAARKRADGCLYSNVFGGNLPARRADAVTVFDCFGRFQIGYETTNQIDNLLIFGEDDECARDAYRELVAADPFFADDAAFRTARRRYVEAADEDEEAAGAFLDMLVRYRRGMFFRIPSASEQALRLWDLTIFRFAGEYLNQVCALLGDHAHVVPRQILARLVKGLNRVFTGMMVDCDDRLYLAVSGSHSQARVSRIFIDSISVRPSKGERITLAAVDDGQRVAVLRVEMAPGESVDLVLNLVRYEFLSRVAENGALPGSFSRECNEDILAFKSRLVARLAALRTGSEETHDDGYAEIRILSAHDGRLEDRSIAIRK
jgi:hypothetical protein